MPKSNRPPESRSSVAACSASNTGLCHGKTITAVPSRNVFVRIAKAAALGAREVERVVADVGADAVLAGAGVANLAAWVAVARARAGGSRVTLTAELGLWGYEPTPADPYIFNHRVFPGTPLLADASTRPNRKSRGLYWIP